MVFTQRMTFILSFLLLYSCSSSHIRPYENVLADDSSAQSLISSYLDAISLAQEGENQESCQVFKELGKEEDFPEQSLIFIKTLEVCNHSPIQLTKIWEKNQYLPEWIKPKYIDISLTLSKKHNMDHFIAKFSFQAAKYEKLQKNKIRLLDDSISLAKKNNKKKQLLIFQKALQKIAPRFNKKITKENIYLIARDHERNRNFKQARKLYKVITRNRSYGLELIYKSYNRIRLSYKNERNLKQYILETKKMYKRFNKGFFYKPYKVKTSITYARAVWTDHKRSQAKKILRTTLNKNTLNNQEKALIHWLLGLMKLERAMENPSRENHFNSEAIWYFKKAYAFKSGDQAMNDKLRWSISFTYFLQKNYQKSHKLFSEYKQKTKSSAYASKFTFWEAKSLHSLKEYEESSKLFKKLGQEDPYSYYGIMATKEAKEIYSPLNTKVTVNNTVQPLNLPSFEWLSALKENNLAIKYLRYKRRNLNKEDKLSGLLPLFHRSASYDNMIHLYFSLKDTEKKGIIENEPKYVYPRPFMEKVILAEKKSGVDRNLILSISRQESAFNPLARSHADAFGVMQLLPERGRSVASENNIPFKDYYDLFKPEKNIMLGAILLSQLQKSFSYKFPLYVASYNASSLAVKRWYKDRYKGDFIKFIEMIPYAETQKYVKLVLRNYFIYKRLNSNEAFLWNPALFNKV